MPYLPPGSDTPTALPIIPRTKHRKKDVNRPAPLPSIKKITTAEDILADQLFHIAVRSPLTDSGSKVEEGEGEGEGEEEDHDHDPPMLEHESQGHPSPAGTSIRTLSSQGHGGELHPRSLSISHDLGEKTPDCEHVEHALHTHSPSPPASPSRNEVSFREEGGEGDGDKVRKVAGEMEAAVKERTGIHVEIRLASPGEKDAVSMYSEAIYAYTHSLYLQAKTSSASSSSKSSSSKAERKKTGSFGSKMSGMERMAQQKALAARLNG
ncbi:hypothetical protein B9479_006877 [Cryptococcus floricola]|uniref:Uncharacterized protein n=1 Tax=Cryptococcus floricola TaxID=2591691 RepID=A0A5D3ALX3_9TREE|nr:hypothetical protein B9479_006877 [Cryptococcus floricola]